MIRLKLALLVLIASLSAGCKAEESPQVRENNQHDRMMAEYQEQKAQYEAMRGSKVLNSQQSLMVFRDKANGVTCWSRFDYGHTLSCLPDWMFKSQEKAQ